MPKLIDIDMKALEEYLLTPHTADEIQEQFKIKSHMAVLNVVTKATYRMYLYEYVERKKINRCETRNIMYTTRRF